MRVLVVASTLLVGSGFCALVYQTVWFRDFRLILGASTPSTAAVLALFMGGLGAGSLVLGKRAERFKNPLLAYAHLELGITLSASVSPFILDAVRSVYYALGGSTALGDGLGTVVRLLLATLVIGAPAFLMGGTLPAVARWVTSVHDTGRRGLALMYGANTIGAVCGAFATTFLLFEMFGFRLTLWLTALLNGLVALVARGIAQRYPAGAREEGQGATGEEPDDDAEPAAAHALPRSLVLAAAFTTGFVFFLVELVWYRMSAPILGGTTYTFGLVLIFALLGIGIGGALYSFLPPKRATPGAFALTCALEAFFLVVPLALGDSFAILTLHLRGLGALGFGGLVSGWAIACAVLVLPAAVVSGYQFPLLLALKGRADAGVASDVGEVYAANTLGSVAGSLAGGFVLVPLLMATGAWQLCAWALLALAVVSVTRARVAGRRPAALSVVVVVATVVLLVVPTGPTAAWRHTAIGAGRAKLDVETKNDLLHQIDYANDWILEEHDGRESALAFTHANGLTSLMSGKSDGNSYYDAPTQVGLGMFPALLHGAPQRTFVIGLGTGQTSGWLAQVPSVEVVDTAEIEPAMLRFGELCAPSNENALENPKVRMHIADGREALITAEGKYDIIASAPSNPYRAGLASFYSEEFYAQAKAHLKDGGYFSQWMQGYEIDAGTLQLIVRTMRTAFPYVSMWRLLPGDLLLLGTTHPQELDVEALRARLAEEPFRRAFGRVLRVYDVEGLLAHAIASPGFAAGFSRGAPTANTDDRARLEYLFARNVGRDVQETGGLQSALLFQSNARQLTLLPLDGAVDEARLARLRRRGWDAIGGPPPPLPVGPGQPDETAFWRAFYGGDMHTAAKLWRKLPPPPAHDLFAVAVEAELLTYDATAGERLDVRLAVLEEGGEGTDVAWLRLLRALHEGAPPKAIEEAALVAFAAAREDAWNDVRRMMRALYQLGTHDLPPDAAGRLARALLERPFANYNGDLQRRSTARRLAARALKAGDDVCVLAFASHVPWTDWDLRSRVSCYARFVPERSAAARAEHERFLSQQAPTVQSLLPGG